MKAYTRLTPIISSITFTTLLTLFVGSTLAALLGTAFTYQGRSASGTNLVYRLYDIEFTVYAALAVGNAVAATIQDDGTNKTLIVNPPTGNRFYRLFKP